MVRLLDAKTTPRTTKTTLADWRKVVFLFPDFIGKIDEAVSEACDNFFGKGAEACFEDVGDGGVVNWGIGSVRSGGEDGV